VVRGGGEAVTVWTSGDICRHYGISRSNFAYWRNSRDFPDPLTYAKNTGGTWDAAEVRAWVQAFRRGDPATREKRVAAVRQFKGGATISAIARNVSADRKTVRRWLHDAGALVEQSVELGVRAAAEGLELLAGRSGVAPPMLVAHDADQRPAGPAGSSVGPSSRHGHDHVAAHRSSSLSRSSTCM
jgi:predicted DNA-binding transcriptional regulator AlpA